ncbi:MAG: DUF871 domain-containing protein [Erysipelotrichaceae bacterium]
MLGISLYPDQTKFEDDVKYLDLALKYGFKIVFMSILQIDINNPKKSINRIKESIQYAKKLKMEVTLDVHPFVFKYLKIAPTNLKYFFELGVTTIRIDSSFDGKTEAEMTNNPYGINIELNMSNNTNYLDLIHSFNPNKKYLRGSHNFYPQRLTGLSLKLFKECSQRFSDFKVNSAAFITAKSATISPWPIAEGLCTLELHRSLPISTQVKHYKMLNCIDDLIIGDAYASESELQATSETYNSKIDTIKITIAAETSELEKEIIFENEHEYRGDTSEFVIRSSKSRLKYTKDPLPKKKEPKNIKKGDILILNEEYGQYKAELQISLCDRQADSRVNVVGRIINTEMLLLSELKPFQKFKFEWMEDNDE